MQYMFTYMMCFCDTEQRIGIGVLQVRRPEGVRRNALRAQRPKSPHFEESAQAQNKTRRSVGDLWAFCGFLQTCLYNNAYNSSARKGFCAEEL